MIKITGIKSGSINNAPTITNLKETEITTNSIKISYHVEDAENQIVRHYLLINGDKKEITPEVGYDKNDFEYNISGLERNTDYTIQIICSDGITEGKSDTLQIKTINCVIYGFKIDENNSDPFNSVTYTDDAIGITPANGNNYGGWEDKFPFNLIRPCALKKGDFVNWIQKNNFSKYEDGKNVGEDVDVMIYFPKIYWSISKVKNIINVKISEVKIDNSFVCPAHTKGNIELNQIYIGAYLSCNVNNILRSIRAKVPAKGHDLDTSRRLARANGIGYELFNYTSFSMLQILFVLMYKTLNSDEALGTGFTSDKTIINTGSCFNKGMNFGSPNNRGVHFKFLGIEDLIGNLYNILDGLIISNNNVSISDNTSNDKYRIVKRNNLGVTGYMNKAVGNNVLPFFPIQAGGSGTTYYSSNVNIASDGCFFVGADGREKNSGIFYINTKLITGKNNRCGERICYLG